MENFTNESFFQTRLSKALNVSVDQKTRLSIFFKICSGDFETLRRAFQTLALDFEDLKAFEN